MRRNTSLTLGVFACLCLGFVACTRSVQVTKQMTWQCAPEEYNKAYYARPDEYVRLRYVENPKCEEVESARNLCREMQNIGKPVVDVQIDVWGGSFLAAKGYRLTSIENRPLVNVGGWGHSGCHDTARSPIGDVIDSLR